MINIYIKFILNFLVSVSSSAIIGIRLLNDKFPSKKSKVRLRTKLVLFDVAVLAIGFVLSSKKVVVSLSFLF
jgi:putative Mn2+ efflux pump MntP